MGFASAEDRLIGWLRAEIERRGLPDRLGDDAAFLGLAGEWAVSVDQQIEGSHFQPDTPARRIGRRLVSVNLSDLAACGARPGYALATLAAPRSFDFKSFFRGLLDGCEALDVTLIGGDLAAAPRVSAGLTVFGRRPPRGRWLRRNGARPGDHVWLGGTVGESALGRALLERGARLTPRSVRLPSELPAALRPAARRAVLRHAEPSPLLELGEWLGRRRRAGAIDVSDGVLIDLERMARASGVVCRLDVDALPTAEAFQPLADEVGESAERLALAGGEDYVLLFALPPGIEPPHPATRVGRVVGEADARTRRHVVLEGASAGAGAVAGWDHLAAPRRGARRD